MRIQKNIYYIREKESLWGEGSSPGFGGKRSGEAVHGGEVAVARQRRKF